MSLTAADLTAIGGVGAFATSSVLAGVAYYQARQIRGQVRAANKQVAVMGEAAQEHLDDLSVTHLHNAEGEAWLTYVNRLTWLRYVDVTILGSLLLYAFSPSPRAKDLLPTRKKDLDLTRDQALVFGAVSAWIAHRVLTKERNIGRPKVARRFAQAAGTEDTVWQAITNEMQPSAWSLSSRTRTRHTPDEPPPDREDQGDRAR